MVFTGMSISLETRSLSEEMYIPVKTLVSLCMMKYIAYIPPVEKLPACVLQRS